MRPAIFFFCSRVFLFILPLIGVSDTSAQELKLISVKQPSYTRISEFYEVIADQPEVKQGLYKKYIGKKLVESGQYKSGRKTGIWSIRDQKKKLVAEGMYIDDHRAGIWVYYAASGQKVQMYDHDRDSLIYFNLAEERKYAYAPPAFPDTSSERIPLFIGGNYYMRVLIENNLVYPPEAWKKERSAKVVVSFVVDREGITTEVESKSQAGDGFDEEAVRLIELLGKSWIPGYAKGNPVKVTFTLPVTFKIT